MYIYLCTGGKVHSICWTQPIPFLQQQKLADFYIFLRDFMYWYRLTSKYYLSPTKGIVPPKLPVTFRPCISEQEEKYIQFAGLMLKPLLFFSAGKLFF